jgi:serine/threonine-protein phosphatase 2B catalytic subunit
MELFDALPLGAIINKKFIAFHGGISPQLKNVKDLNKINRFKEPPKSGVFCDLLWSDPIDA